MEESELAMGSKVRYPRTGTEGKIEGIDEIGGELFAAIDSTHLFYRIDQLIPLETLREKREGMKESIEERLRREKEEAAAELDEAVRRVDGECGG